MKFKILKHGSDENVLGEDRTTDSPTLGSAFPVTLLGYQLPEKLDLFEWTLCRYNLSGTEGTYKVLRVE